MLIVILVIVVLLLFAGGLLALFRQITIREMAKNTAHLQALSQEYLKKQDELKQRVAEGDRHYREQLESAKSEIDRMKTQAVTDTETTRQQMLAQARQESEQLIQKAMESKEALKCELEQAMQQQVLNTAEGLVRETLSAELRQTIQAQWVNELIEQGLASLPTWNSREQVREAQVISAVALTDDQRKRLRQRLAALAGGAVTLQEAVDPALLAGLTITLGHTVLDGSLRSRLEKATRHVRNGHNA